MASGCARLVGEVYIGAAKSDVELLSGGCNVEPGKTVGLELRDGTGVEA